MKQFKLPKEFAEKWLTALRNGEYKQGEGYLQFLTDEQDAIDEISPTKENCSFCCLGVAGVINGVEQSDLFESELFYPGVKEFDNRIPSELIGRQNDVELVQLLTNLNDGLNYSTYNQIIKNHDYIFRINPDEHDFSSIKDYKLDFNQIADFIEDNCEFYEVETIKN